MSQPLVVMLPGMGADHRMFAPQRAVLPKLVVPDWLPPAPDDTLETYATRMASVVPTARPLVLGGSSFGGMLACEMARQLRPDLLLLIGSVSTAEQIPSTLRFLARCGGRLPGGICLSLYRAASAARRWAGIRETGPHQVVMDMLRATPPSFMRWACRAIGHWSAKSPPDAPTWVIHGHRDWVLPCGRRSIDTAVPAAGHLLTLTHPAEVNDAICDAMRRFSA